MLETATEALEQDQTRDKRDKNIKKGGNVSINASTDDMAKRLVDTQSSSSENKKRTELEKLKLKLNRILADNNSLSTKSELIANLIEGHKQKIILEDERKKLLPANQSFLVGGKVEKGQKKRCKSSNKSIFKKSASSNDPDKPGTSGSKNDKLKSNVNFPMEFHDNDTITSESSENDNDNDDDEDDDEDNDDNDNHGSHVNHDNADNNDNDDNDNEDHEDDSDKNNDDDNDDDNGSDDNADDDNDDDDDDDNDDDDDDDNNDNMRKKDISSVYKQLLRAENSIKSTFKIKLGITLGQKTGKLIRINAVKLSKVFNEMLRSASNSQRTLSVIQNRILLVEKSETRTIFTVNKLLACLSLNKNNIYNYLRVTNEGPFSKIQKSVLRFVVRQSNIATKSIPCEKVRKICKL